MREREERAPEGGSPLAAAGTAAAARSRRRLILVVDDDQALLSLAIRSLRSHGHDVRGAASGREALLAIYGGGPSPALLLTDVEMPGMSGIELAARVAADRPGVAIALMSGNPALVETARDRPELVRAVLVKPFTVDELLGLVGRIIGQPEPEPDSGRVAERDPTRASERAPDG